MQDAILGARAFVRGFALLLEPRVRRWAVLPIALSALLYVALLWLLGAWFADLAGWLQAQVPGWLAWLEVVLWVLFAALALLLVGFTFVLVTGLLSGPFLGPLAGAVERHLTGSGPPEVSLGRTLLLVPATLLQELRKASFALLVSLAFLLPFLVPGAQAVAPLLWFLACAWLTAFTCFDYPMSNHGRKLSDIRRVLQRRLLLALGFGSVAFCACTVPVLNLLALPAGVCGATALWLERVREAPPAPPGGMR